MKFFYTLFYGIIVINCIFFLTTNLTFGETFTVKYYRNALWDQNKKEWIFAKEIDKSEIEKYADNYYAVYYDSNNIINKVEWIKDYNLVLINYKNGKVYSVKNYSPGSNWQYFDENSNLIKLESFNQGEMVDTRYYFYEPAIKEKSRLYREECYKGNIIIWIKLYTYDENDNRTELKHFTGDDRLYQMWKWFYNKDNSISKEEYYNIENGFDKPSWFKIYTYNDNNEILKVEKYNKNEKIVTLKKYTYLEKGKLLKFEDYDYDFDNEKLVLVRYDEYVYSADGKLKKVNTYAYDRLIRYKNYVYKETGELNKIEIYNDRNRLIDVHYPEDENGIIDSYDE